MSACDQRFMLLEKNKKFYLANHMHSVSASMDVKPGVLWDLSDLETRSKT